MTSWHKVGGPLPLSLAAVTWAAEQASMLPSIETNIVAHILSTANARLLGEQRLVSHNVESKMGDEAAATRVLRR